MTDWSGERLEGLNPSDRSDPDASTGLGPRQPAPSERTDGQSDPEAPPLSGEWLF